MRRLTIIAVAALATGCARDRIVKIGWDSPAVAPYAYGIVIDAHLVREIPPPPLDVACQCLMVAVPVPRGPHTVQVIAYNAKGDASAPSATLMVR